jgi:uncharacterized protein
MSRVRKLTLPQDEIRALCRRHRVAELALFGSVPGDDFGPESDVDFLVRFEPGAEQPWMGHFQALEDDLSALLGRRVDVVDWKAIERSRNWIRREAILSSAQPVDSVLDDEPKGSSDTEHLLRSPTNAERLFSALARARRGEGEPETVEDLRRDLGVDHPGSPDGD